MGVYVSDENGNLNKYAGVSPLLTPSVNKILNMIYPVGSIYMSVNDISPQVFIGGTWEKIEDTFLLASGTKHSAGATGGEETHTLTASELPSHSHSYSKSNTVTAEHTLDKTEMPRHSHDVYSTSAWSNNAVGLYHSTGGYKAYGIAGVDQGGEEEGYIDKSKTQDNDGNYNFFIRPAGGNSDGTVNGHSHGISSSSATTTNTGTSLSHNNMPPYLAVYMWKRVA